MRDRKLQIEKFARIKKFLDANRRKEKRTIIWRKLGR